MLSHTPCQTHISSCPEDMSPAPPTQSIQNGTSIVKPSQPVITPNSGADSLLSLLLSCTSNFTSEPTSEPHSSPRLQYVSPESPQRSPNLAPSHHQSSTPTSTYLGLSTRVCVCVCVCVCVQSLSHVQAFATPCGQPGSVHGIFQARILEWIAISFSWGSS